MLTTLTTQSGPNCCQQCRKEGQRPHKGARAPAQGQIWSATGLHGISSCALPDCRPGWQQLTCSYSFRNIFIWVRETCRSPSVKSYL